MFDLTGKAAVVTGGGRGIGRGITRALAKAGASIVVGGRTPEPLHEAVAEAEGLGAPAVAVPTDITVAEDRARLAEAALSTFGGIDVWINNAGGARSTDVATLLELTEDQWDTVVDLNAKATLFACQTAARAMPHGGSIINISSRSGSRPNPRTGPYGAAKAAVDNLTTTMAVEWGHLGIRVNAIAPGVVLTEHNAAQDGTMSSARRQARQVEVVPLRRLGTPDDIGPLCVYLASDESSWVTGQIIHAEGGSILPVGYLSYLRHVAKDLT
jgi:3-oxoacyl-[acyl-carrier protein] reductase